MKNVSLLSCIILLLATSLNAQKFDWVHPFYGTQAYGRTIINDGQSGIYFGGAAQASSNIFNSLPCYYFGDDDGLFCKTDTLGNFQWMHNIGYYGSDQISKLVQTSNKIYVQGYKQSGTNIIVDTLSMVTNTTGPFLASFDTSGPLNWLKQNQYVYDFDADASGTIYFAASGPPFGHKLYKMNSSGTVIDSILLFTGNPNSYGKQILYDNLGHLIYTTPFDDSITFLGTTYYIPPNEPMNAIDCIIMKCDTNLNVISVKHLSGRGQNYIYDMIIDSQGILRSLSKWNDTVSYNGIIIPGTGERMVFSAHDNNLDLLNHHDLNITLNNGGAHVVRNDLDEFYLGLNYYNSMIINSDTLTEGTSSPHAVGCIAKMNNTGSISWYRNVAQDPTASYTTGSASVVLSPPIGNKIFVTGAMRGPSPTIIDTTSYNTIWLDDIAYTGLLIDTTYGLSTGLEVVSGNEDLKFSISPNPSTGIVTIQLNKAIQNGQITVYDILGNKIIEQPISMTNRRELNLENISSGFYLIVLNNEATRYQQIFLLDNE